MKHKRHLNHQHQQRNRKKSDAATSTPGPALSLDPSTAERSAKGGVEIQIARTPLEQVTSTQDAKSLTAVNVSASALSSATEPPILANAAGSPLDPDRSDLGAPQRDGRSPG